MSIDFPQQANAPITKQLLMMLTAERPSKFVAYLSSHGSRLRKFDVVGIAGRAPTGLGCDKL
jgi:hypothetical protein